MKYRSSVTTFAKAVLCDAAQYRGDEIRQLGVGPGNLPDDSSFRQILETQLESNEAVFSRAAKLAIPGEDWKEIIDYVCRYYGAYNFNPPIPGGGGPNASLPSVARGGDDLCTRRHGGIGQW